MRGFAGILREGLEGEPWEDVVAVPPDFYSGMGLQEVVSALRLRGMGAILGRLKRQIRETMQPEEDRRVDVARHCWWPYSWYWAFNSSPYPGRTLRPWPRFRRLLRLAAH